MLNLLTRYLLQYKTVTIPHVGTLRIVRNAAQLNVVDKTIQPPHYLAHLKKEEVVTEHQLDFLNSFLQKEKNAVLEELEQLGSRLGQKMNHTGFAWNGIGRLESHTESIPISLAGLELITAERVMRQNPDHQVLVGDRQTSSSQIADEKLKVRRKKYSILVMIGWILLGLSVLFIAFHLYRNKFKVDASGSKQSPLSQWIDTKHYA